MQRVTDIEVKKIDAVERARMQREQLEAAKEAEYEADEIRKDDAKLGLYIKRVIAGLPVRRAADRRCEAALSAIATQDGLDSLQTLMGKNHG